MTISFDLDDTLIPGTRRFSTEKQNLLQKALGMEKIRKGTVQLLKRLKAKGHQVFIYTTSFRSTSYIRWMFLSYGIWLDGIINQRRHDQTLMAEGKKYSKYPPSGASVRLCPHAFHRFFPDKPIFGILSQKQAKNRFSKMH